MIHVNGDAMEWKEGLTVREVLVRRNFRFPLLIITVDGELVQPKAYETTTIPDAADVQVVHMMSGG
ncbi:MAG: sulfur carrier protein ThiS [Holophaga sp.]|nr:sulfur carrier protein ThiS [Holophaga sp.]